MNVAAAIAEQKTNELAEQKMSLANEVTGRFYSNCLAVKEKTSPEALDKHFTKGSLTRSAKRYCLQTRALHLAKNLIGWCLIQNSY